MPKFRVEVWSAIDRTEVFIIEADSKEEAEKDWLNISCGEMPNESYDNILCCELELCEEVRDDGD